MRTIDLWKYLPPVLKDFLEIREIMKAEEPEFQTLANNFDDLATDSFITEATAKGISKYEAMLKIYPSPDATLESRRSTVLTRWWDVVPYTLKTLKNRIVMIQGDDNVQVVFVDQDHHRMRIVTNLERPEQLKDLDYIIETMIPANMEVESLNQTSFYLGVDHRVRMGATITETIEI